MLEFYFIIITFIIIILIYFFGGVVPMLSVIYVQFPMIFGYEGFWELNIYTFFLGGNYVTLIISLFPFASYLAFFGEQMLQSWNP